LALKSGKRRKNDRLAVKAVKNSKNGFLEERAMARVGVILSGCGVKDGSEIHEAVCTLLALSKNGAEIRFFAPNIPQAEVFNHVEGVPLAEESRNVLMESARIARGKIRDLAEAKAADLDAIIFPGGLGAVKNLCNFASEGVRCRVNNQVERIINEMIDAGKPIGALCIAPMMLACVLAKKNLKGLMLTIGTEKKLAEELDKMGFCHVDCPVHECVVDEEHKIVTTPCYMLAKSVDEVYSGVSRLVEEVLRFI
jgi:enhancing lycopene biosynthesis protein 2